MIKFKKIGLINKADTGVILVSYIVNGELVRFEKIRPTELATMEVAPDRIVSASIGLTAATGKIHPNLLRLYSIIILERSWGVSRALKPYRYFVTGVTMESSEIITQCDKFISSYEENGEVKPAYKKASLYLLLSQITSLEIGKTPVASLEFKDIGYEAFLMNLCPSETYGKRRHRTNALLELFGEIDLSLAHEEDVRR